jgi:hypothetical protein
MKLIKGKVYFVQWIDTFSTHGWIDVEDMKKNCKKNKEWINTVGFYIGQFHGYEVFSPQFTPNEDMLNWSGMIAIPIGVIKKVERLA